MAIPFLCFFFGSQQVAFVMQTISTFSAFNGTYPLNQKLWIDQSLSKPGTTEHQKTRSIRFEKEKRILFAQHGFEIEFIIYWIIIILNVSAGWEQVERIEKHFWKFQSNICSEKKKRKMILIFPIENWTTKAKKTA